MPKLQNPLRPRLNRKCLVFSPGVLAPLNNRPHTSRLSGHICSINITCIITREIRVMCWPCLRNSRRVTRLRVLSKSNTTFSKQWRLWWERLAPVQRRIVPTLLMPWRPRKFLVSSVPLPANNRTKQTWTHANWTWSAEGKRFNSSSTARLRTKKSASELAEIIKRLHHGLACRFSIRARVITPPRSSSSTNQTQA